MIVSALITQCRQEYNDIPKSTQKNRSGDGSSTLFVLGDRPIMENSYSFYKGTSAQVETAHYTLDKDSGELTFMNAPSNGINVRANYKYAFFRDANWVQAINYGIESLNARGFFRQVVRNPSIIRISAGVSVMSGPSACVDIYELLTFSNRTSASQAVPFYANWEYQQDANKIVLGYYPTLSEPASISYLRNLQTYTATSATLDCLNDWTELVKKKAGEYYFRNLAARITQQGAATIDEGHFSFTNARTMALDLANDFEALAVRKKPVRPARRIKFHLDDGGSV